MAQNQPENPTPASSVLVVEVVVVVECSSNSCSSTFMKGLQEEATAIKETPLLNWGRTFLYI